MAKARRVSLRTRRQRLALAHELWRETLELPLVQGARIRADLLIAWERESLAHGDVEPQKRKPPARVTIPPAPPVRRPPSEPLWDAPPPSAGARVASLEAAAVSDELFRASTAREPLRAVATAKAKE